MNLTEQNRKLAVVGAVIAMVMAVSGLVVRIGHGLWQEKVRMTAERRTGLSVLIAVLRRSPKMKELYDNIRASPELKRRLASRPDFSSLVQTLEREGVSTGPFGEAFLLMLLHATIVEYARKGYFSQRIEDLVEAGRVDFKISNQGDVKLMQDAIKELKVQVSKIVAAAATPMTASGAMLTLDEWNAIISGDESVVDVDVNAESLLCKVGDKHVKVIPRYSRDMWVMEMLSTYTGVGHIPRAGSNEQGSWWECRMPSFAGNPKLHRAICGVQRLTQMMAIRIRHTVATLQIATVGEYRGFLRFGVKAENRQCADALKELVEEDNLIDTIRWLDQEVVGLERMTHRGQGEQALEMTTHGHIDDVVFGGVVLPKTNRAAIAAALQCKEAGRDFWPCGSVEVQTGKGIEVDLVYHCDERKLVYKRNTRWDAVTYIDPPDAHVDASNRQSLVCTSRFSQMIEQA